MQTTRAQAAASAALYRCKSKGASCRAIKLCRGAGIGRAAQEPLRRNPQVVCFQEGDRDAAGQVFCDVAICGGGLGGLAIASALQARGYDARVFEAAPELRTAAGTYIGVSNNGSYALDSCAPGALLLIMKAGEQRTGFSVGTKTSKDGELQRESFSVPPELKQKTFGVRWGEVQRVLASFVTPELVHCSHRVSGYTEVPEEEFVCLHFKDQPDVKARLAVAADGVRSSLRNTMIPTDPGPRYLGHMNYSALLYNPDGRVVPHTKGYLQRDVYKPPGASPWGYLQTLVSDAGGGYTYWVIGLESPEPVFLPDSKGVRPPQGYLGARAGTPGCKEHVVQLLRDVGFDHLVPFVEATAEEIIYERSLVDRVPLDELGAPMYSKGGRVVLLGDAAHAMHPGPGVGAQMAFEDASVLVTLLDEHRDRLVGWANTKKGLSAAAPVGGTDADALWDVLVAYNDLRMARACRTQRFAAEFSGVPELRVRAPEVPHEKLQERFAEFILWATRFPDLPYGDPESKYWKPVQHPAYLDKRARMSRV